MIIRRLAQWMDGASSTLPEKTATPEERGRLIGMTNAGLVVGAVVWDPIVQQYGYVARHRRLTRRFDIQYGVAPGRITTRTEEDVYRSMTEGPADRRLQVMRAEDLEMERVPVRPMTWSHKTPRSAERRLADITRVYETWVRNTDVGVLLPSRLALLDDAGVISILWHPYHWPLADRDALDSAFVKLRIGAMG